MKHLITFAAVVLSMTLFLSAGCSDDSANQKSDQEQTQELSEKGEKGKMEMSGEVPPAPGDEAIEKQEQKDEPVQKQTQKQSQKS